MPTGSVKAEGGVPSNPALAAEVTEGCPLPLGMAMEAVTAHSCVVSFHQAPVEHLGCFRPTCSGLFQAAI